MARAGDFRQPLAAGHAGIDASARSGLHGASHAGRVAANPAGGGGRVVPRPELTAALIHIPLTLGALALSVAFLGGIPVGFQVAVWLLGLAFGVALTAIHLALWRAPVTGSTVIALRCALGALLVMVGLGLLLSGFFGWGLSLPVVAMTHLHAAWGLMGWTVLLVAGVATRWCRCSRSLCLIRNGSIGDSHR